MSLADLEAQAQRELRQLGGKGAPFPYFEAVGGVCRAVRDNLRCDVDDFDKLLSKAREHETAGLLGDALQCYERLSSL